ncbi:hypothetical protein [Chitinivorax sp. B]|uniref:hypothetical protein n=1 Tax=Chitinivorax sp. B TaxID=2502235 RepID=UPI0010F79C91|nr:hypothetical protein [Chitinivorax sp. B]
MDRTVLLTELEELLSQHRDGLYTDGELASLCLEVMGRDPCGQVWEAFPERVKSFLIDRLGSFSDADDVVTFGHGDAQNVKREMLRVRAWLTDSGLI